VPCPGASVILLFASASGALGTGVLAVLVMSLGMGGVLATVGGMGAFLRGKVVRLAGEKRRAVILETWLRILGGAFLLLFGALLLAGSL
jgi:ABC-type nickel/cobalt efflux system permease component RcnA